MADMRLTERFVEDLAEVWSASKRQDIRNALEAVQRFPGIGSRDLPRSIRAEFGETVRKMVVTPFDIVYEYDEPADRVFVLALVPQRMAR